jgi:eukaryotic-like serine/threonine-protein kinase
MKPEHWKELQELYHSALGVEPMRRKEFLAQACGHDESLCKEVERMLDHQSEAETFMEAPAMHAIARRIAEDSGMSEGTPSLIGKSLGHYQIISRLGKGGMGEVYRAKDHKLGRDVAIKVLRQEVEIDAERVARFQREAKVLASLNHPNIAAIYGLEQSDGKNFLVLELVEGETVADWLKRGPISVEDCLKLALQIVEALETAHEKGVVHRDLKPANISVTPEGKVKVLDFGLAKALAKEQPELSLANSMTLSSEATREGIILGTASYMSPEQARGKQTDKRADIWSFGCVLYEMLTGRQAWTGVTVTDTIAAVLVKDPDFNILPPNLHPRLRELLGRCLQKDPIKRFRDVGDIRVEITRLLEDPHGASVANTQENRAKIGTILAWVATAAILSAIIAGFAVWQLKPNQIVERRDVTRFDYDLPKDQELVLNNLAEPLIAVSPDGRQLAYCTPQGIYLRSINEMGARLIRGTEDQPRQPVFSPDGQWIAYWSIAKKKVMKIPINGGSPMKLAETEQPAAGFYSWETRDSILYSTSRDFVRLNTTSGQLDKFMEPKNQPSFTPRLLPGGKAVIFTTNRDEVYKIAVQSLESGDYKELTAGSDAYYCPTTGHLVFVQDNDIVAAPFDIDTLTLGSITILVKNILRASGAPQFALSASGTLAYIPNEVSAARTLERVDRDGKAESLGAEPNAYGNPRISPDGTKLALSIGVLSTSHIAIWDLVHGYLVPKSPDKYIDTLPIWKPDGKQLVFFRRTTNFEIHSTPVSGFEIEKTLASLQDVAILPECWANDGKTLLVTATPVGAEKFEIRTLTLGDNKSAVSIQAGHSVLQPTLSPDGKWMAYTSNESGRYQVWICPFPQTDKDPFQVSKGGGDSPLWSPDGRELFYRCEDEVLSVPLTQAPNLFGEPKSLFKGRYVRSEIGIGSYELHSWDISHDGKRFLMMKEVGPDASAGRGPRKINIVLNWFEELKQQVPVR